MCQVGYVMYITTQECVARGAGDIAMIDWRSSTIRRVCRSTPAAETMSAIDAVDAAVVMRASLMSFLAPELDPTSVDPQICSNRCGMDCASLHYTIHKEGAIRLPAENRPVLDPIGVKDMLPDETQDETIAAGRSNLPLAWCPTGSMLVDVPPKRMDGTKLRGSMWGHVAVMEQNSPSSDDPIPNQVSLFAGAQRWWRCESWRCQPCRSVSRNGSISPFNVTCHTCWQQKVEPVCICHACRFRTLCVCVLEPFVSHPGPLGSGQSEITTARAPLKRAPFLVVASTRPL